MKKIFYIAFFLLIVCAIKVFAIATFQFFATNNKDLEKKLEFLDKLSICEKFKYQEDGIGSYEIFGKVNNACKLKWTLVDCNFPEGVYQEFSNVQKKRTLERYDNRLNKYYIEIENKDYRYIVNKGNLYCQNRY